MAEERRIIFYSTDVERVRPTLDTLSGARFVISMVSEVPLLMREVRNARDRVVVLDFGGKGGERIDGLRLLREIKRLDGSIQVLVINAEPRVFVGIQIFRAGGEACFFAPGSPSVELLDALDAAFNKIGRWWRALREVGNRRAAAESEAPDPGNPAVNERRAEDLYPNPDEEVELVVRGLRLKGKTTSASTAGMELLVPGSDTPALAEKVLLRFRGLVNRGVVRRMSSHASGAWLIGLEWMAMPGASSVTVGVRAERALFVTLDGCHVVARSLTAVNNDLVSARLATGRICTVPTQAVCALTRAEREAELLATDDLSFFADFYELDSLVGVQATVEAIMAIEFAIEEAAA